MPVKRLDHFVPRRRRPRAEQPVTLEPLEGRTLLSVTWSQGIKLPAARAGDAAVLQADQSILVVGGGTTTVNQLAAGGTVWGEANPIDVPRVSAAVGLTDKGLLVYGGNLGGALDAALSYDPVVLDKTQDSAAMSTPRDVLAFAADGLGRLYAIGGVDDAGTRLASAERFDPAAGAWSAVAAMPLTLSAASAAYDGNGHIYVFGGATDADAATTTVLRYNVNRNIWRVLPGMPVATAHAAAVRGGDGNLYVLGGLDASGAAQATTQVYSPAAHSWSVATALPRPVSDEAAVVDSLGRIELIGGFNAGRRPLKRVTVSQILTAPAAAPTFTSTPPSTPVAANASFTYQAAAAANPLPEFSLVSGPAGMTVDRFSGLVAWQPPASFFGAVPATIRASNAIGSADQSFTIAVPGLLTPTAPTNLTVSSSDATSVTLSWGASTDNVGVVGYVLYRVMSVGHSGRGGGFRRVYTVASGSIASTSYMLAGVKRGSSQVYTVVAFDTAGKRSVYSNFVVV